MLVLVNFRFLWGFECRQGRQAAIVLAHRHAVGLARHRLVAMGAVLYISTLDIGGRLGGDTFPRCDVGGTRLTRPPLFPIHLRAHTAAWTAGGHFMAINGQSVRSRGMYHAVAERARVCRFTPLLVSIGIETGDSDCDQRHQCYRDLAGSHDLPPGAPSVIHSLTPSAGQWPAERRGRQAVPLRGCAVFGSSAS